MGIAVVIELKPHTIALLDKLVELGPWGMTREAVAAGFIIDGLRRMMETPGFATLLQETLKRLGKDCAG